MRKVLVVYFSRSGYTRKIGEEIAARCDADIEPIRDVRSRSGIFGYFRSAREALKKRVIDIQPPTKNPSDYELIILGTPVWASNVSSPIRSYIDAQRERFAQVALFCTLGGSGASKVLADMGALCGKKPVATIAVTDAEIKKKRYAQELDRFMESVALPKAAA